MKNINPLIIQFYKFINDDINNESFEKWVYDNKELESIFQKDHYFDIISYNYKSEHSKYFIKSVVKKQFDLNEFEKWRTIELLEKILSNEIEFVLSTRKLRQLYKEQEDEIKEPYISLELGIGYESCLDECPIETEYHLWNSEALKKQLDIVNSYRVDFMNLVQIELNNIKNINKKNNSI